MAHIASYVPDLMGELARWREQPQEVWGIPTGIRALDLQTGGLHQGEYTLIAANTNVGKSALTGQIVFEAARHFVRTRSDEWAYVFSNEMMARGYLFRELVGQVGIPAKSFRKGEVEDFDRVRAVAEHIAALPVDITYDEETSMDGIKAVLREGINEGRRPGLVVLDYIQNTTPRAGEEKRVAVGAFSKRLAGMARHLNVPVLVVAQLNRKALEAEHPSLGHLAESADLERSADNVWLIYRPDMADLTKDQNAPQDTVVFIGKVRSNGERGSVPLVFHPRTIRFYDPNEEGLL